MNGLGGLLGSRAGQFGLMSAGAALLDASRPRWGWNQPSPLAAGIQAGMQGMMAGGQMDEQERQRRQQQTMQEALPGMLMRLPSHMRQEVAAIASVNPGAALQLMAEYQGDRPAMYEPEGGRMVATGAALPTDPRQMPPMNAPAAAEDSPIWQRHNNPGNLRPVGATEGFQTFPDMASGVDAMRRQIDLYWTGESRAAGRPLRTVRDIVSTYAPPSENPTDAYVARVSRSLGVDADAPLDRETATSDRFLQAMIDVETGGGFQIGGMEPGETVQLTCPECGLTIRRKDGD